MPKAGCNVIEDILGYGVSTGARGECVDKIYLALSDGKERRWLACLNPHSYAVARSDSRFARALKAADWLIPDGVGIVLASGLLGGSIRERVTGSDIFYGLCDRLEADGGRSVFFMGATEDTLQEIRERFTRDYPNIKLAGTYSPPFKPEYSSEEIMAMVACINAAKPDVLWVGMTAPKQEKWIVDNLSSLDVRFVAAVGAVFDFYAGRVKRASPVFQRLGLEWLPRLVQQPRRLWRRMLVSAPVFVWHVLREKLGGRAGTTP